MRSTFSLGILALLLSGSALAPALVYPVEAATQAGDDNRPRPQPIPGTDVALRESIDAGPTPQDSSDQVLPEPVAPEPIRPRVVGVTRGQASWYGPGFYGNRTANGEILRRGTFTAAHRTLPFGTKVRVTNLWNGRTAEVRINDRGPFHGNRVIDLAHGAADELGLTSSGVAQVKLEVLR